MTKRARAEADTQPDAEIEISVSRFKARCLSLLQEMSTTGIPLVITKRGRRIARLVPFDDTPPPSLLGSVLYEAEEDLLAPVDERWDADS